MRNTYAENVAGRVGDSVEVRGISGGAPRRGQIVSVLGDDHHRRYAVRWDDMHESILYPADGVMIMPASQGTRQPAKP